MRQPLVVALAKNFEIDINGMTFIFTATETPCFMCKEKTNLIEISFEAGLHVTCGEKAWAEMQQRDREVGMLNEHL